MAFVQGSNRLVSLVNSTFDSSTFSDGTWNAAANAKFISEVAPNTRSILITGSQFVNNIASYLGIGVAMKNLNNTYSWAGEVRLTPGLTGLTGFYVQLGFNAGVFSGQQQPASGPSIALTGLTIEQFITTPNTFVYGGVTLPLLPLGGKLYLFNVNNAANFTGKLSSVAQLN